MATYTIDSVQDLEDLALRTGKFSGVSYSGNTFVLTADLDIGSSNPGDSGEGWVPIGPVLGPAFDGIFDGQNHTISNLTINRPFDSCQGLFGLTAGSDSLIKNLILHNINVVGAYNVAGIYSGYIINCKCTGTINITAITSGYAGVIVGYKYGSEYGLENCSVDGDVSISADSYYVGGIAGRITNDTESGAVMKGCSVKGTLTVSSSVGDVGGLVGSASDYTIENCYVDANIDIRGGGSYIGGLVGETSDVIITNCYVTGSGSVTVENKTIYQVGGLVGNAKADITNCYCTVDVVGLADKTQWVGGLVGDLNGTIQNCYATGDVTGDNYVGGLVGYAQSGDISNCYTAGTVTGTSSYAGGFVGYVCDSTIQNCYSIGAVAGTSSYAGGFVGYVYDNTTIQNCYATGDVIGDDDVGGFAGCAVNDNTTIQNCYVTGAVDGNNYVGGFVGYVYDTAIQNCYSIGSVSGNSDLGGFIGRIYGDPVIEYCYWNKQTSGQDHSAGETPNEVEGKTTTQMRKRKTFINWDFVDVWGIVEDVTYPKLRDLYVFPRQYYLFSLNLDLE